MKPFRSETEEVPDQSSSSSTSHIIRQISIIMGLLGLAVCGFIISVFILQIIGGIFLGILMAGGESTLHTNASPDNQTTATVVSDSCGITCGCTIRVDIETNGQYTENIWRENDICDATITWINNLEFYILYKNNQQTRIDLRLLDQNP